MPDYQVSSATDRVHWVKIEVFDQSRNKIEVHVWTKLLWHLRVKYDWYFKYRAALCQVKYPKYNVQFTWGNEPAEGKPLEEIIRLKRIYLKGQVTKFKNKLAEFEEEFENYKKAYCQIFPIEEQDQFKMYMNSIELAVAKIRKKENELSKV